MNETKHSQNKQPHMNQVAGKARRGSIMTPLVKAPIRFYRKFISPLKPPTCRFYPSCSMYALEAVEKHGALKGSWLAAKRIGKCHPFHPGGFDPVPDSDFSEEKIQSVHDRK